jgi:tetratricopeptide (TPR) repeat protein
MMSLSQLLDQARQLHQVGNLTAAQQLYHQILQIDPTHVQALDLLGLTYHALQRFDDAMACFRKALQWQPNFAPAHNDLANTLAQLGHLDQAIDHYRQAIRLQPIIAPLYLNLGNALQQQGKFAEAAEAFRQCLSRQPDAVGAHFNLANVLQMLGEFDQAIGHYREAIRIKPTFAEAHNNLGSLLFFLGKAEEGTACFDEAFRLKPDYVDAIYNQGNASLARGRVEKAIRFFQKALDLKPDHAPSHNNLAEAYLEVGDTDKAQIHFRAARQFDPRATAPLLSLAQYGFYGPEEPSVEQLRAWLQMPRIPGNEASKLHFTLAYLYEQACSWDKAFEHFDQGNKLRRSFIHQSGKAFDAGRHEAWIERLIAVFTGEYFRLVRGSGMDSEVPVFIVGMPRSGTTLVEQILSQHPHVFGAGERPEMGQVVAQLQNQPSNGVVFPENMRRLDSAAIQSLAQAYLQQLASLGGPALRVTDKGLENYLHLGIIATLFPRARIIHCKRDPRDVCFSCFCQFFKGLNFTWDLEDLAAYYRAYDRLMAHWHAVLPVPILEVVYEDLVANLEPVSRRLVAFCGLEWDERCLKFHENRRPVQTVSKLQVRQPIYQSSVGRWRRYARHLQPLLAALGYHEDSPNS